MVPCRIESLGVSWPHRHWRRWGSVRHAVEAGRRCLKASQHREADIGLIIHAGVHRDLHICEPAMAVFVQHRLGINVEFQGRGTLSFDLQNGGCGMLDAAQAASALLQDGETEAALVLAGEANPDRHPDPGSLFPASGAALLLDRSPWRDRGFGAFAFHTRDDYADVRTSWVSLSEKRGRLIVRQRAELEDVYLSMVGAVVDDVLARDRSQREEIDLVVPAQISSVLLARLPAAIGFPADKVAAFPERLPDTLSTSLFLAFKLALDERKPLPGQKALLLAFGSGITVAAAVYRF
ncbi:MAG TPA: 3-oxoacyl-[acyl-carrier-protein] synthase III C-terminal domain-containing protein [Candidatus Binatia bacterium]|nr:3-oxoacyl-[acyl-carrier-protein] synthase III C-terminal domain-containing protein [Candidatus Binatia bacterium]